MPTCTFFGHRDTPDTVIVPLRKAIESIIETEGVDTFLVGNEGHFDKMVIRVLRETVKKYPSIKYSVVLAYHPSVRAPDGVTPQESVFPDCMDNAIPKFAISKRNTYMLRQSDHVIAYASHIHGGAYKFADKARSGGKLYINLAEI